MPVDFVVSDRGLPRALRWAYVVWFCIWTIAYWRYFGPQFLLWFCCLANVYVLLGCLTQRALWFSLAALAALGPQVLHSVDLAFRLLTQASPSGATDYMFDATRPITVRLLSLFHVWMPVLIVYALRRVGYDQRALAIQTLIASVVVVVSYSMFDPARDTNDLMMPLVNGVPFDRDFNLNWVHAFYDRPEPGIGARRFWSVLIGYPLVFHIPVHLLLSSRPWVKATATARPSNDPR